MAFERPRQQLRNLGNEEKHKFVMNILITLQGSGVSVYLNNAHFLFICCWQQSTEVTE